MEDSTPLKRFKTNRSGYLKEFQKEISTDASKHGRKAGTAVFLQKGSTLKVIEEFNIQGKQTSFYKYCPRTFGYILLYVKQIVRVNVLFNRTLIKFYLYEECTLEQAGCSITNKFIFTVWLLY